MSYRWSAGKVDSGDINFSEDLDDHTKIDFEIDQIKLVANNTEYFSVTTGSVNIAMSGVVGINGGSSGHSGLTVLENGRVGIGTTSPSTTLGVSGTTKSNFYTTTVTTQDLGSGTNSNLSTASGIVLLDADSINGIDMGGGMEVHSLAFPTPNTSGQKLTIIAKNASTNNTMIMPSGLISGSFSGLADTMGVSVLSFVQIVEGSHKAWYQV